MLFHSMFWLAPTLLFLYTCLPGSCIHSLPPAGLFPGDRAVTPHRSAFAPHPHCPGGVPGLPDSPVSWRSGACSHSGLLRLEPAEDKFPAKPIARVAVENFLKG